MTNPASYFAATDLGAIYPHTHCVRVDSLSSTVPGINFALKVLRWIKNLEPPTPP